MFRCFVLVVRCTHSLVSSPCTRVLFEPTTFSHHSRVLLKGMNVVVSSAAGNKIVIVIYLILFNSRLGHKLTMLLATGSYFRVGFGLKVVITLLSGLDDVFVHNSSAVSATFLGCSARSKRTLIFPLSSSLSNPTGPWRHECIDIPDSRDSRIHLKFSAEYVDGWKPNQPAPESP